MPIDPSIPLQIGQQQQRPDILGDNIKAISLASLLDQRRMNADEAERNKWLQRREISKQNILDTIRKIAGEKAIDPKTGKFDQERFADELLRQGDVKTGFEAREQSSKSRKSRSDAAKVDFERASGVLKVQQGLMGGVYEMAKQYGPDHPATIAANDQAVAKWNEFALQNGVEPSQAKPGQPVDIQQLEGALSALTDHEQRIKEAMLMPPEVRAGMKGDEMLRKQKQDKYLPAMEINYGEDTPGQPPADPNQVPVSVQTFNPDQIRPEEMGGTIPGQAPQVIEQGPAQPPQVTDIPGSVPQSAGQQGPNLTMQAIMNQAKGKAGEMYTWNPTTGQADVNEDIYNRQLALKKAGAAKQSVNVGVNAYEKQLGKNRADRQNKYEDQAVAMQDTTTKVRAITDSLSDFKGQRWAELGAKMGEWLPGSDMSKITSARDLSNAMRAELAPKFRIEGSGATSDFEMKQWLAAIPSLVNSPQARADMLKMAEKFAKRAEAVAEIHGELIEQNVPTGTMMSELRKRVTARLGESVLDKDENARLKQYVKGDVPPPGGASSTVRRFNPATGRIE